MSFERFTFPIICALIFITAQLVTAEGVYVRTENGGALVWHKGEQRYRVTYWSGGEDNRGFASGEGVLQVVAKGKLVCVYAGVMREGRMNGFVTAQFPQNGLKYEGEVRNHDENGAGRMVYPNGAIYAGEWRDALWHGRGLYRFPDGQTVVGTFYEGRLVRTEYRGYPEEEENAQKASPRSYSENAAPSTSLSDDEQQRLYELAAGLVLTLSYEAVKRGMIHAARDDTADFGDRLMAAVIAYGASAARDASIEATVGRAFPGMTEYQTQGICKLCAMVLDGKLNASGIAEEACMQVVDRQFADAPPDSQTAYQIVKFLTAISANMKN